MQSEIIDLTIQSYNQAIDARLGQFGTWSVVWHPGHIFFISASLPWLFAGPRQDERENDNPELNDGYHMILFPQDNEGLCPRAWLEAAWPYLEKFRSNFGFHFYEALLYKKVTLIGLPLGNRFGVSQEVEDELRQDPNRQVERIPCQNAEELAKALQKRMKTNLRYPSK